MEGEERNGGKEEDGVGGVGDGEERGGGRRWGCCEGCRECDWRWAGRVGEEG